MSPQHRVLAPQKDNGANSHKHHISQEFQGKNALKTKHMETTMIHWHVSQNIQGPISSGDDPNPPLCPGLPEGHPGCLMPTYSTTLSHTVKSRSETSPRQTFSGVTRLMVTSRTVTSWPHDSVSWPSTCSYSILSWRLSSDNISVAPFQSFVVSWGCGQLLKKPQKGKFFWK